MGLGWGWDVNEVFIWGWGGIWIGGKGGDGGWGMVSRVRGGMLWAGRERMKLVREGVGLGLGWK